MDHYVAVFNRAQSQSGTTGDDLQLPAWGEAEWRTLFGVTTPRPFKASEVVIQRGVADRALYFVAAGSLEVGVSYVDGVSISPIAVHSSLLATHLAEASQMRKTLISNGGWRRTCVKANERSLKELASIPRTIGAVKQAFWCSA